MEMMNKNRIEKPDNIMFGSPWFFACPLPDSIPLRGHLPKVVIVVVIMIMIMIKITIIRITIAIIIIIIMIKL